MRRKYRKYFIFSLLLILLTGCASETRNNKLKKDNEDYCIKVGIVQKNDESDWSKAQTESLKQIFTNDNGYELVMEECGYDQIRQIEVLHQYIEKGVDYIILNPVTEIGWDEVVEEVYEARIPLIIMEDKINVDEKYYKCWVGSDIKKQIRDSEKWINQYLRENGRENENIIICNIQGEIGTLAQLQRAEVYQNIIQKHERWSIEGQQTGHNTYDGAAETMRMFLENEPEIDIVLAESDEMALGASSQIEDQNQTVIMSIGGTKLGLESVRNGTIDFCYVCSPNYGPKIAEVIQRMDAGISVERDQYLKEEYYDQKSSLDEIINERTY